MLYVQWLKQTVHHASSADQLACIAVSQQQCPCDGILLVTDNGQMDTMAKSTCMLQPCPLAGYTHMLNMATNCFGWNASLPSALLYTLTLSGLGLIGCSVHVVS